MGNFINKAIVVIVLFFFITTSVGDKTLSLYSNTTLCESGDINVSVSEYIPNIDDIGLIIEIRNGVAVVVGVKNNITEIIFPGSVRDDQGNVYDITEVEKPDDGKWDKITSIVFTEPSKLEIIEKDSMEGLDKVKSLIISSSVVEIETSGILCLENIEWIVVPDNVLKLGQEAFKDVPSSCKIYCEADKKPSGWNSKWVNTKCKVYWGEGDEWKFNNQGVPTPIT